MLFFFLRIRRPPRSTLDRSSAASDVYKRQEHCRSMRRCDSGHDRGDPRWPYHGTPKGMTRDARPRQPTRRIGEMWYPTHAYESDSSSLHRPSRITPSICKPETRLLLTSATIRGPPGAPDRSAFGGQRDVCLLYTSPSPRDRTRSRMPSSA